jgi:hypothetical protein
VDLDRSDPHVCADAFQTCMGVDDYAGHTHMAIDTDILQTTIYRDIDLKHFAASLYILHTKH